jgi:hypothetical protein
MMNVLEVVFDIITRKLINKKKKQRKLLGHGLLMKTPTKIFIMIFR